MYNTSIDASVDERRAYQARYSRFALVLTLPCKARHIGFKPSKRNPYPVTLHTLSGLTPDGDGLYMCDCRAYQTVKLADELTVMGVPK